MGTIKKYHIYDCTYIEIPKDSRLTNGRYFVCKNGNRSEFGIADWVVVRTINNGIPTIRDPLGFFPVAYEETIGIFFCKDDAEIFVNALIDNNH